MCSEISLCTSAPSLHIGWKRIFRTAPSAHGGMATWLMPACSGSVADEWATCTAVFCRPPATLHPPPVPRASHRQRICPAFSRHNAHYCCYLVLAKCKVVGDGEERVEARDTASEQVADGESDRHVPRSAMHRGAAWSTATSSAGRVTMATSRSRRSPPRAATPRQRSRPPGDPRGGGVVVHVGYPFFH